MQSAQKAGEPSMEDILASIRKIIAEDPNAAATPKPVAPARAMQPAPTTRPVAGPISPGVLATGGLATGAPTAAKPRGSLSDLDKELSDLLSEPIDVPPAARPAPAGAQSDGQTLGSARAPTPDVAEPSAERAAERAGGTSLGTWFRGKPSRSTAEPQAGPANEPHTLPSLINTKPP